MTLEGYISNRLNDYALFPDIIDECLKRLESQDSSYRERKGSTAGKYPEDVLLEWEIMIDTILVLCLREKHPKHPLLHLLPSLKGQLLFDSDSISLRKEVSNES